VDNSYNEAWDEAKNSGEKNVDWNKYYFCQNLTLAGAMHEDLHNDIKDFHDKLAEHKNNLAKYAYKKHFRINNTQSSYALKPTSAEYDDFLANLSKKYQNSYMSNIIKIEEVFENNRYIAEELMMKCEPHQRQPQNIVKKPVDNINSVQRSKNHYETIGLIEFKSKAKDMNKNEKKIFDFLVQMHERINKIVNKYLA
jgi:hypothetical protein